MNTADFIKFNDDELAEITQALNHNEEEIEQQIRFIAEHTQTKTICVTTGSDGALLYQEGKLISQPGFPIKVKDTVGAGDSFLATLLAGLLQQSQQKKLWKELVPWVQWSQHHRVQILKLTKLSCSLLLKNMPPKNWLSL